MLKSKPEAAPDNDSRSIDLLSVWRTDKATARLFWFFQNQTLISPFCRLTSMFTFFYFWVLGPLWVQKKLKPKTTIK